jgi:hypothetical protein
VLIQCQLLKNNPIRLFYETAVSVNNCGHILYLLFYLVSL